MHRAAIITRPKYNSLRLNRYGDTRETVIMRSTRLAAISCETAAIYRLGVGAHTSCMSVKTTATPRLTDDNTGNDDSSSLWSPYGIGQTIIFLWRPCVADADIIFLPCGFYLSIFLYSSPNLSSYRLDVYHTSKHGVALVRI